MREPAHDLFHLVVLAHVFSVNSVFEPPGDRIARVAWEKVDSLLLRADWATFLPALIRLISFKQLEHGAGEAPLISCGVVLILEQADFWGSVPPGADVAGDASLLDLVFGLLDLLVDLFSDVLFGVLGRKVETKHCISDSLGVATSFSDSALRK